MYDLQTVDRRKEGKILTFGANWPLKEQRELKNAKDLKVEFVELKSLVEIVLLPALLFEL